jgi:hypothetical protein
MNAADKPGFMQLLAETLAAYGKPLPEAAMARAWLSNLQPYPMQVISAAMRAYIDENGEFPPVPAGIAKRCKLMDGRLGPEEAWALALTSLDQSDTVVWSTECAEAFRIVKPVLDASGAISARKGFIEAYERLVGASRAAHQPVEWVTSVGWDMGKRKLALARAVEAGVLPAPSAISLLPAPAVEKASLTDHEREQLHKVLGMLREGESARQRRLERAEQERLGSEMALDIDIQRKVDLHHNRKPT